MIADRTAAAPTQNTSVGLGSRCQPNAATGSLPVSCRTRPAAAQRGQGGPTQVGRAQLGHRAGQVGRVAGRVRRSPRPARR